MQTCPAALSASAHTLRFVKENCPVTATKATRKSGVDKAKTTKKAAAETPAAPERPRPRTLRLDEIDTDSGCQTRVNGLDDATIARYAEKYNEEAAKKSDDPEDKPLTLKFRPHVFWDGDKYWLSRGFHRYYGRRAAGFETLDVLVFKGGILAAFRHALGDNAAHGLPRTNADKKNEVKLALENPATRRMSDRDIAALCKVAPSYVWETRNPDKARERREKARAKADLAAPTAAPEEVNSQPAGDGLFVRGAAAPETAGADDGPPSDEPEPKATDQPNPAEKKKSKAERKKDANAAFGVVIRFLDEYKAFNAVRDHCTAISNAVHEA